MQDWSAIGFEIELTKDSSPTLRLIESLEEHRPYGESMHHSAGAATETQLIYGNPIQSALEKITKPRFLVVGLGLGYIEMTLAQRALLLGKKSSDVGLITSYESVPELRETFVAWLHDQPLASVLADVYKNAALALCLGSEVTVAQIKEFLKPHFPSANSIQGPLSEQTLLPGTYHGILFDAFSSKTTPHLWEDRFFHFLLSGSAQADCFFSTYSGRATMRQCLKEQGFQVIVRQGIYGKRTSTLAGRGVFAENVTVPDTDLT